MYFVIEVKHAGKEAGSEVVKAKDEAHAERLGAYVALTVARDNVRPGELDPRRVTFEVQKGSAS